MAASADRALPRGPHDLSRDEVAASQRRRLLDAMTEAVAEKGYAKTVVADVVARSGVSRATFYQQFADKDACFRAAYAAHAELVTALLAATLDELRALDLEPLDRLDRLLGVYLDALQGAPAVARVFLVEVYAAGPALVEQRHQVIEAFVDLVAETHAGGTGVLGTRADQRFAAEFVVAAVSSMVTNLVGRGRAPELTGLRAPLIELAARILR